MKYGGKANLSIKSRFEISDLEDDWGNCSECKELLEIQEVAKKVLSYLRKALDYSAQKGVLLAARAGVGRRELFLLPPSPESLHFGKKNCSVFSVFALVARNRTNEPTRRIRRQRYRCRPWIFRKT